jgi:hypothetical protein
MAARPDHFEFAVISDWDMELEDGTEVDAGHEVEVHALVDGNELLDRPELCLAAFVDGERLVNNVRLISTVESALEAWEHVKQ